MLRHSALAFGRHAAGRDGPRKTAFTISEVQRKLNEDGMSRLAGRGWVGLLGAAIFSASLPAMLMPVGIDVDSAAFAGTDVPVPVQKAAVCMLEVLKATPGVIEPALGTATIKGATLPFLEYRADEALTSLNAIRFQAKRDDGGGYFFIALASGFGVPETHVTDAVLDKWKTRCHAEVILWFV